MTGLRRLRQFSLRNSKIAEKLSALRAARLLRQGGLIAHHTATLPGVAAIPNHAAAIARLQLFKQRKGPFLLLADSVATATSLARYFSPELRRQVRAAWPGPVTLVFAGKPGLPACCYQHGYLAVRVDASLQTRQLVAACGGLMISSSLNRRGAAVLQPGLTCTMRMHRFLRMCLEGKISSGKASSIVRVRRNRAVLIRHVYRSVGSQ